jgi:hypothetical protein
VSKIHEAVALIYKRATIQILIFLPSLQPTHTPLLNRPSLYKSNMVAFFAINIAASVLLAFPLGMFTTVRELARLLTFTSSLFQFSLSPFPHPLIFLPVKLAALTLPKFHPTVSTTSAKPSMLPSLCALLLHTSSSAPE